MTLLELAARLPDSASYVLMKNGECLTKERAQHMIKLYRKQQGGKQIQKQVFVGVSEHIDLNGHTFYTTNYKWVDCRINMNDFTTHYRIKP